MAVYDDVVIRLAMLGYEVTDADQPAVQYQINRAERYIKNNTNLPEVPEGLSGRLVLFLIYRSARLI